MTLSARPERLLGLADGIKCDVMIEPEIIRAYNCRVYIFILISVVKLDSFVVRKIDETSEVELYTLLSACIDLLSLLILKAEITISVTVTAGLSIQVHSSQAYSVQLLAGNIIHCHVVL